MQNNLGYILISYASLLCFGVMDNSRGPAYPQILEHFGLSMSQGSLVFAVASLSGLPMIMLGRWWLKLFGEVKAQIFLLLLMSAGCFGMGFSGFMKDGYPFMLLSSALFGLGMGGTTISSNVLIAYGSSQKDRRRIFSGLHTMYGLSSVLAPVVFGLIVKGGFDWRYLFMFLSLPPLVTLTLGLRTKQISHGTERSKKPSDISFFRRMAVGLIISLYAASEVAISSRLVLFAVKTMNITVADAAPYLTVFFALLLLGRFAFSVFKFPWSSFKLMVVSACASLVLYFLGIFIHPIFLSACGLTMSFYFPYGMDLISSRFGKNTDFIMTSVMTSVAVVLVLMHVLIGVAADAYGIRMAMLIGPALLIAALVVLVSIRGIIAPIDKGSVKSAINGVIASPKGEAISIIN